MSSIALKILRMLEKSGDASLEEIAKLIPKNHGDHRDFYVFASLITRELINDPFITDDKKESVGKNTKEQLLARKYFAMSNAEKTATYQNHSWSIHGGAETLKGQRFALSGPGYLYLSELMTKRFDRAFTIGSGILIGIVVALTAVLIERYTKGV